MQRKFTKLSTQLHTSNLALNFATILGSLSIFGHQGLKIIHRKILEYFEKQNFEILSSLCIVFYVMIHI